MIFFSIGLPSRLSRWCDALVLRLLEHHFGATEAVALNGLEDLAIALIRTKAAHLLACSRHPAAQLQTEIIKANRPVLVALGDPIEAVRHLVEEAGYDLTDATRAVANSCAAMKALAAAAHALVLVPDNLRDPRAVAEAIADHLQIPVEPGKWPRLLEAVSPPEEKDRRSWLDGLSQAQNAMVTGALEPYTAFLSGGNLETLIWEPGLFYMSEEPVAPGLVPVTRPVEITGRARFLVYGPFISLPPGRWVAEIVLGFSAEAAGVGFTVEIFAGTSLAHTGIESTGEQVTEIRLDFTIANSANQPLQIRIYNTRAAFDGRLALGYAALTRQAAVSEAIRERLTSALRQ
jgi:hypothetical protein